MLLASGAAFGFRRTLPHMLGVVCGFFLTVLSIGMGLDAVFRSFPDLYAWLRYLGSAYLLYLAWKIATSSPRTSGEARGCYAGPLSFLDAAAFQWVNPKSWTMAVAALSSYMPPEGHAACVVILSSLWALITLPCIVLWTGGGSLIRRALADPARQRRFNLLMALLMAASLYPMWR